MSASLSLRLHYALGPPGLGEEMGVADHRPAANLVFSFHPDPLTETGLNSAERLES